MAMKIKTMEPGSPRNRYQLNLSLVRQIFMLMTLIPLALVGFLSGEVEYGRFEDPTLPTTAIQPRSLRVVDKNVYQETPNIIQNSETKPEIRRSASDPAVFQIALLSRGNADGLFEYSKRLYDLFDTSESKTQIELLVTKCMDDDESINEETFAELFEDSTISTEIIPLNINRSELSTELAHDALAERACNFSGCYFSVVDIDLIIGPEFIDSVMSHVESKETIYVPVVKSEHGPSSVRAFETIFGPMESFDIQNESGYGGLYAIFGETLHSLRNGNKFPSILGGEDAELEKLAAERGLKLVRKEEPALVHFWDDVEKEGDQVCRFIKNIRADANKFFNHLVGSPIGPSRSYGAGSTWAANEYMRFSKEMYPTEIGNYPRRENIVTHFLSFPLGYQLAKVVRKKIKSGKTLLRLHYFVDDTEEWVEFDGTHVNAQETYSFENCTKSDHPSSSVEKQPSANVSCRRVHYKAPPKQAFERAGKVMVGVLSSAKKRAERDLIRETWGDQQSGIFFIVSGPWEDIQKEHEEYQDIIWIEGEEHVLLITYKTAMFLDVVNDMARDLGLEYTHVLKTDDDSYVAMARLQEMLSEREDIDFWGECALYVRPFRDPDHKYYVSKEEYPKEYFPPYCQGGGIVFSRKMVECAATEMQNVNFLSMEDAWMGMVAERCGIYRSQADPPTQIRIYRGNNNVDTDFRPANFDGGKIIQHRVIDAQDMRDHHAAFLKVLAEEEE